MTQREKYKLKFGKKLMDGNFYYSCETNFTPSFELAGLLEGCCIEECEDLLEQISNAIHSSPYINEPYYESVNYFEIEVTSSHLKLNGHTAGSLDDMQILLQEWIAFVKK